MRGAERAQVMKRRAAGPHLSHASGSAQVRVVSCEFAEENGGIRRADYLAYLKINKALFIKQ